MAGSTPETMHEYFVQVFNSGDLDQLMELFELYIVFVPQPGQIREGTDQDRCHARWLESPSETLTTSPDTPTSPPPHLSALN